MVTMMIQTWLVLLDHPLRGRGVVGEIARAQLLRSTHGSCLP
jgi:hypothetical protein